MGKESAVQLIQLDEYRKLSGLRSEHEVLKNGDIRILYAKGDVLIYERYLDEKGRDHFGRICQGSNNALCILNRSDRMFLLVDHDPVSGVVSVLEKEISSLSEEDKASNYESIVSEQTDTRGKIVVAPISYKIIIQD